MSREYEAERAVSRDDVATALRQLADGVAAGSVAVDSEAGPVAVDVPTDLTFEVELEADDDEIELEVELEWETGQADASDIRELDESGGSDADQAGTAVVEQDASPADETDEATSEQGTESTSEQGTESTAEQGTESTAEQETGAESDLVDLVGPATDPAAPTDAPESKARFELFRDAADEWRWRLRHRNGNVIADGGEGYGRKASAINGIESVKSNAPHAVVEEESQ